MPHIHEKIDFTVDIFIIHKKKVLLRKHDKYKLWLAPGGHIELDEEPNQAAIREAKEEVGLDVKLISPRGWDKIKDKNHEELIPPMFLNRHRITSTHDHVSLVYFARSKTDKVIQSDTEVSEECRWFTREELDAKKFGLPNKTRFYAKKALEFVK